MAFDTALLDRVLAERQAGWEQERQQLLHSLRQLLNKRAAEFGVEIAYVFGSLIRPNRFTTRSDVDIAVESVAPGQFIPFKVLLETTLKRDVGLILLEKCHFADDIRREGELWIRSN
ncbi:MAG: nucleotidyltransferase domain-containing protein [Anaerolineales bacterium]|nr:nucleotidyltransferase domain-containing protein [Anaerolineales bacterium]